MDRDTSRETLSEKALNGLNIDNPRQATSEMRAAWGSKPPLPSPASARLNIEYYHYLCSMSKTRNYLHIVFGTKYHQRTILQDKKDNLYAFIGGIIKNKKSESIAINGMENHIHILIDLHPTVALADLVRDIKVSSSKMLQRTFMFPNYGGWASEYFACSVSPSHTDKVKEYINNQELHHGKKEYGAEMEEFVRKLGFTLYKDDLD